MGFVNKKPPKSDVIEPAQDVNISQEKNRVVRCIMDLLWKIPVAIILVALLILGVCLMVKWVISKTKDSGSIKGYKKTGRSPKYSEKDKDMLRLINELSAIYQKTDNFLHISK